MPSGPILHARADISRTSISNLLELGPCVGQAAISVGRAHLGTTDRTRPGRYWFALECLSACNIAALRRGDRRPKFASRLTLLRVAGDQECQSVAMLVRVRR